MRYLQQAILSLFLSVVYTTAYCAQSIDSFNRYYFSSYNELVKFFEHPSENDARFSQVPTDFYADVYHRKTLDQAVTACVYHDHNKGVGHYASQITTYIDPKTKRPYEVPTISSRSGSYHNNPEFSDNNQTSSNWKIIAPSGEVHDSAEYANNPVEFDALWKQPNNIPNIPGIQCSGQVVQNSDGSNSFQVSIGDQDVCAQTHANSTSMNNRHRAAVQKHQQKILMHPYDRLNFEKNDHKNWIKKCEKYLSGSDKTLFQEKKDQLISLKPPTLPEPKSYYEVAEYNKSIEINTWLYDQIEKLTKNFIDTYFSNSIRFSKEKAYRFKDHYIASVDRITQELYQLCPSLTSKMFTAVRLSHDVIFRQYDTGTLADLSGKWSNAQQHRRHNKQRMKALNDVKQSKGLMRDYSKSVQTHASFADPDAHLFDNCFGTALDQQLHEELCDTRVRMTRLVDTYTIGDHPDLYAPIVYRCTARAKEEQDISTAFSLSDYSDALVRIVSRGMEMLENGLHAMRQGQTLAYECDQMTPDDIKLMGDITGGFAQGAFGAAKDAATLSHWTNLVKSVPKAVLHAIAHYSEVYAQHESLERGLALRLIDTESNFYERAHEQSAEQTRQRVTSLEQTLVDIASLPAHELARHAGYCGTSLLLDSVALKGLSFAVSSEGRELIGRIAKVFESPHAPQAMAQVAGVGKVAIAEKEISNIITKNSKTALPKNTLVKSNIQEITKLLKIGNELDKGGLTSVGRSLQKHGSRTGSIFPKPLGNTSAINAQGEAILREILIDCNTTKTIRHHARFGDITEYKIPGGKGARFSIDEKNFIGFIEP